MPHEWVGVGVMFSFYAAIIHSLRGRALITTNTCALSEQHWGTDGLGSAGGPSSPLQVTPGLRVSGAALHGAPAPSTAPQGWCLGQGTDKQLWCFISSKKQAASWVYWSSTALFQGSLCTSAMTGQHFKASRGQEKVAQSLMFANVRV